MFLPNDMDTPVFWRGPAGTGRIDKGLCTVSGFDLYLKRKRRTEARLDCMVHQCTGRSVRYDISMTHISIIIFCSIGLYWSGSPNTPLAKPIAASTS